MVYVPGVFLGFGFLKPLSHMTSFPKRSAVLIVSSKKTYGLVKSYNFRVCMLLKSTLMMMMMTVKTGNKNPCFSFIMMPLSK